MTACRIAQSLALTAGLLGLAHAAPATYLEVLGTISDHAVLQQGDKVVVPGFGEDGDTVTVTMKGAGKLVSTAAAVHDGKWSAGLGGVSAGGPYDMEIKSASGHVYTYSDIYVGEVWVASGQSNMDFKLVNSTEGADWLKKADIPKLHLFHINETSTATPAENVIGSWEASDAQSAKDFSAVAWHFGRRLTEELDVPVGIVQSDVGGSIIRCWTSEETLSRNPNYQAFLDDYAKREQEYPQQMADFDSGKTTTKPSSLLRRRPVGYYNAMIHPLTATPIRGVIWYQGESDSWNADDYYRLFPDLIKDWRAAWNEPDMPFLFVQLAAYAGKDNVDYNYPFLRDAQASALSLPHTAMATAIDVGNEGNIHPTFKRPVGERLAAAALSMQYGKDAKWQGPIGESAHPADGAMVVEFSKKTGRLKTSDGAAPRGFAVATEDGVFHEAQAEITGPQTVSVRSAEVPDPKYVRYAWTGFPNSNVVNEEGLPAYPWRSDSIPWSRQ